MTDNCSEKNTVRDGDARAVRVLHPDAARIILGAGIATDDIPDLGPAAQAVFEKHRNARSAAVTLARAIDEGLIIAVLKVDDDFKVAVYRLEEERMDMPGS